MMKQAYKIRKGEARDFPAVLEMIKELAIFEKAPDKVTNSVAQMEREKDYFELFVVEFKDEIIAMSLYYFTYFTWVGKSLYLDDLYVKPEHRGAGIGQELLKEIFKVAQKEDCSRVRWQVLDWNEPAIQLYNKIGATLDKEWINCDFDKDGIREFKVAD
jgi:GNAT superfamily N-acetyltransferase